MVPEQDGKIGDPETKKGGNGTGGQKKDAGKGPDQGCLIMFRMTHRSSCTYQQSFANGQSTLNYRDVKAWIRACIRDIWDRN